MEKKLDNIKVAILATNGVEESEFKKPLEALKKAGAEVDVISLKSGKIKAWDKKQWGGEFPVTKSISDASIEDYDALVLPGGVMNPDQLRMDKEVVAFTTAFFDQGKPIGAICHGPWTLIETGKLHGRTLTSYPSLKTDITNAGAYWVDEEVVVDNGLITSRTPDDLPAFCEKLIEEIAEKAHA